MASIVLTVHIIRQLVYLSTKIKIYDNRDTKHNSCFVRHNNVVTVVTVVVKI